MPSNSVCNLTRTKKSDLWSSDFVNHLCDHRPNWTPLGPIAIINFKLKREKEIAVESMFMNKDIPLISPTEYGKN